MRKQFDEARGAVDKLLPAASAMKRRRTEAVRGEVGEVGAVAKTKSAEEVAREQEKARLERARKKRDQGAEIDVAEEIRKRREREIREREMEEERVREGLEGLDVRGLRGLVQIEEMDVPVKVLQEVQQGDVVEGQPERAWKEEWNGRKNFKGFKPRGEAQGQQRTRKIIVKLEEVKKKAYGIGEEYWVSESVRSGSKKSQESQSQRRSQALSQQASSRVPERDEEVEEEEQDDSRFRRTTKSQEARVRALSVSMVEPDAEIINTEDQDQEEELPETIIVKSTAEPRGRAERSLRSHVAGTQVPDVASPESQRRTRFGKRIAQEPPAASMEPPVKKGRAGRKRVEVEEDSDDEDGLKFRRRKKK